MTYTHATGRLSTVADRHGATWTVAAPTLTADAREVVLSSTARSPITYRYDRGNVTARATWRDGVEHTEYFGYHPYNPALPLDPRNDQQIWSADARSADAGDGTYPTTKALDTAGRVTDITYPKPAGQATNPTETFTYATPPPPPGARRQRPWPSCWASFGEDPVREGERSPSMIAGWASSACTSRNATTPM